MSFLTPSIVSFIKEHATDDVRKLALCKCDLSGDDLKTALQQIEGLQKAKQKLPSWAANDKVVYPVQLSLEQCSSEATARFKAQLVTDGDAMADLTGGFGIDFTFISRRFKQADYVETNETLCKIAENNLHAFGLTNWQVFNTDAESYLKQHNGQRFDLLFVDPARRDSCTVRLHARPHPTTRRFPPFGAESYGQILANARHRHRHPRTEQH